jgi:hypothetical protein
MSQRSYGCSDAHSTRGAVTSIKTIQNKAKKLTTYTPESHQKSNMMIFNDKLSSYENGQPTKELSTLLSKILARELISRERASTKFWTDAYRELSETLSLPIVTACQDSDLISLKPLLQRREALSQSLTIRETSHQNKSLLRTSSPSYISTAVDKWVSDRTQNETPPTMKSLEIVFRPTPEQKIKIDKDLLASNYVYNTPLVMCYN